MPFNGRRKKLKIVAPQAPAREDVLIGGLKNAIERGETLQKAAQSFLNAGYSKEEVSAATTKIPALNIQQKAPIAPVKTSKPLNQPVKQVPKNVVVPPKKQASKTMKILLITISALVLIGVVLLIISWLR